MVGKQKQATRTALQTNMCSQKIASAGNPLGYVSEPKSVITKPPYLSPCLHNTSAGNPLGYRACRARGYRGIRV